MINDIAFAWILGSLWTTIGPFCFVQWITPGVTKKSHPFRDFLVLIIGGPIVWIFGAVMLLSTLRR